MKLHGCIIHTPHTIVMNKEDELIGCTITAKPGTDPIVEVPRDVSDYWASKGIEVPFYNNYLAQAVNLNG